MIHLVANSCPAGYALYFSGSYHVKMADLMVSVPKFCLILHLLLIRPDTGNPGSSKEKTQCHCSGKRHSRFYLDPTTIINLLKS